MHIGILVSISKLIKSDLAITVCVVVDGFKEGFVSVINFITGDVTIVVLVTSIYMLSSKVISCCITFHSAVHL